MSRTWILYNKPVEPNFTHAGLLLALGLHENLCVLTITDVYRYLSQVCLTFLFFLQHACASNWTPIYSLILIMVRSPRANCCMCARFL